MPATPFISEAKVKRVLELNARGLYGPSQLAILTHLTERTICLILERDDERNQHGPLKSAQKPYGCHAEAVQPTPLIRSMPPVNLTHEEETLLQHIKRNFPNGASPSLIAGRLKWRSDIVKTTARSLATLGLVTLDGNRITLTRHAA